MIVALIIALGIAAAAVGGCIAFGVRAMNAAERAATSDGLRVVAERDRDVANAARVQATAERDRAVAQLVKTQKAAVVAGKESVDRVKADTATADAAGVVDILNGVLGSPLSNDDPDN